MIEHLTIADLMRFLFWGFFASTPLFLMFGAGESYNTSDPTPGVLPFMLAMMLQVAICVACYVAGVKS